jgi:serine/threonine protein kinase
VDFGISSKFKIKDLKAKKIRTKEMLSKQGTLVYMAPEMFTFASYNETVDIWSLGKERKKFKKECKEENYYFLFRINRR